MLNNHIAQAAAQAAALYSTFDTVAEHQKIIATKLNEAYWVDEQKKLTSEESIKALKEKDAAITSSIQGIKTMQEGNVAALNSYYNSVQGKSNELNYEYMNTTQDYRKEKDKLELDNLKLQIDYNKQQLTKAQDTAEVDKLLKVQESLNRELDNRIKTIELNTLAEKLGLDIQIKEQKIAGDTIRSALNYKKLLSDKPDKYSKPKTYTISSEDKTKYYVDKYNLNLLKPVDVAKLNDLIKVDDKTFVEELSMDTKVQKSIQLANELTSSDSKFANTTAVSKMFNKSAIIRSENDLKHYDKSLTTKQREFIAGVVNHRVYQDVTGVPKLERYDVFGDSTYDALKTFNTDFTDYVPEPLQERSLLSQLKGEFKTFRTAANNKTYLGTKLGEEELAIAFNEYIRDKAIKDMSDVSTGKGNFYAPPPLKVLAANDSLVANTFLWQNVFKQALDPTSKSMDDTAESMVNLALGAVDNKAISLYQATKELSTIFRSAINYNNTQSNYTGYHLPRQNSYNITFSNGVGDTPNKYNLDSFAQLSAYIAAVKVKNSNIFRQVAPLLFAQ